MNELISRYKESMEKSVAHLKGELSAIRAGRANPAVLDKILVDYYGTPTKINAMAAVAVSEARVLVITPWDPSTIKSINKAILSSDLGINPTDDGRSVRLVFPQPTEERRKELVKEVRRMGEDGKVAVRNIRRDAIDKLKAMEKKSEITEDDLKKLTDEMQKLTDSQTKVIDELIKEKETEVMGV